MKGMNISRDGVFFVLLIAFFSCVLHTKSCLCRGLEGRRRRDVVGVDCGAARPGEARADVLAARGPRVCNNELSPFQVICGSSAPPPPHLRLTLAPPPAPTPPLSWPGNFGGRTSFSSGPAPRHILRLHLRRLWQPPAGAKGASRGKESWRSAAMPCDWNSSWPRASWLGWSPRRAAATAGPRCGVAAWPGPGCGSAPEAPSASTRSAARGNAPAQRLRLR